jgi:hypothetical protein
MQSQASSNRPVSAPGATLFPYWNGAFLVTWQLRPTAGRVMVQAAGMSRMRGTKSNRIVSLVATRLPDRFVLIATRQAVRKRCEPKAARSVTMCML